MIKQNVILAKSIWSLKNQPRRVRDNEVLIEMLNRRQTYWISYDVNLHEYNNIGLNSARHVFIKYFYIIHY